MKRILSFVLCLSMLFSLVPVPALATTVEDQTVTEETQPQETVVVEQTSAPTEEEEEETSAPTEETEEETSAPTEETAAETEASAVDTASLSVVEEPDEITVETYTFVPDMDLPGNDELFALYAEQQLYGSSFSFFGTAAGETLTGDEKLAYDALVPFIKDVASGKRASTSIALGYTLSDEYVVETEVAFTGTTFGNESMGRLLTALLSDLPYDLYWFDKTLGYNASMATSGSKLYIVFNFRVAANYSSTGATGTCEVDTAKTGAASTAAAGAQAIVEKYAAASDYEKLVGYKDEICALVSYDHDAADSGNFSFNDDPWQLINVFDGDSATNVVCEGYSKAFQYLCDLTDFSGDVTCYEVTGTMSGGTGAGAHMWNIVTIDGQNYLVDVTNSEADTAGKDGSLFMAGGTANADGSYTFGSVTFTYDSDTASQWGTGEGSILTLATENYDPETYTQADFAADVAASGGWYNLSKEVTITSDMELNSIVWICTGGKITVADGATLTVNAQLGNPSGSIVVKKGGSLVINHMMTMDYYSSGASVTVESGGSLQNNGYIVVGNGTLEVADSTGYTEGVNGSLEKFNTGTVSGISKSQIMSSYIAQTEADLRTGLVADSSYRSQGVYLDENVTLTQNLTIPEGFFLVIGYSYDSSIEGVQTRLTVPSNITLTNWDTISINSHAGITVSENGTLVNSGLIYNEGELRVSGTFTNSGTLSGNAVVNDTSAEDSTAMTGEELLAALEGVTGAYDLKQHVVISSAIELPSGVYLQLTSADASITIANGGSLTVPTFLGVTTGGSVTVEEGGSLILNGTLSVGERGTVAVHGTLEHYAKLECAGTVIVYGGYIAGDDAYVSLLGNGAVLLTPLDRFLYDVAAAETSGADLTVFDEITLKEDLTINMTGLLSFPDYAKLVVPSGVTLTLNGPVMFNDAALVVEAGGKVINNADLTLNAHNLGMGYAEINGELTNNGAFWINTGSTADFNGTVTSTGPIHVGFAEGGTLNINGTLSTTGYLAVHDGGTLNAGEGATLNILNDENGCGYLDNQGTVTMDGTMNLDGLFSTSAEMDENGNIVGNGAYSEINGTITTSNTSSLLVGADGSLDGGGTINLDGYMELKAYVYFDGTFNLGDNALIFNYLSDYGHPQYTRCISNEDQFLVYEGTNITFIRRCLAYAEEGYRPQVNLNSDLTLTEDLVIPGNASVSIGATVTVPEGVEIANYGSINVWSDMSDYIGILNINGGLSNYHTDGMLTIQPGASVNVNGAMHNGTVTHVEGGTLNINGIWEGYEPIVTDGGVVNGTVGTSQQLFENLLSAAEAGGYPAHLTFDVVLTEDVTVNCPLIIEEGATLTISQGVELINYAAIEVSRGGVLNINGTMSNYHTGGVLTVLPGGIVTVNGTMRNGTVTNVMGGALIIEGNWEGYEPVVTEGGIVSGSGAPTSQDSFEKLLEEAEAGGYPVQLTFDVELTEDMELNCALNIEEGVTLTVTEGATLTNNNIINIFGSLIVKSGANLENNDLLSVDRIGKLTVASGTYSGNGSVAATYQDGMLAQITGIPKTSQTLLYYNCNDDSALREGMSMAVSYKYASAVLFPYADITLAADLTIAENVSVIINPFGKSFTFTVPEGITLTNNGSIQYGSGVTMVVDGHLINNGTFYAAVDSTLALNQGADESINRGDLRIDGTLAQNNWSVLTNEGGSVIAVNYEGSEGIVYNEVIDGMVGTVEGIPTTNLFLHTDPNSMDDISKLLAEFQTGAYGEGIIQIADDFIINEDLTIPEGVSIRVNGDGAVLTIAEDATVTCQGKIYVENGSELVVNGVLDVLGRVVVDMDGLMTVNGTVNVTGQLMVDGTLINNDRVTTDDPDKITGNVDFIVTGSGTAIESFTIGASQLTAAYGTELELWVDSVTPANAEVYGYYYNVTSGSGYFKTDEIGSGGNPIISQGITVAPGDTAVLISFSKEEDLVVEVTPIVGYDENGYEIRGDVSETITIETVEFSAQFSWYKPDFEEDGSAGFFSGRQTQLYPMLMKCDPDVEDPYTYLDGATFKWDISGEGAQYVTPTEKDGVLTLTISDALPKKMSITVTLTPLEVPGNIPASPNDTTFILRPKASTVDLAINGEVQTGKTVSFDLNREVNGAKQRSLKLDLIADPADAVLPDGVQIYNFTSKSVELIDSVTWKSANEKVATVDKCGNVTFTGTPGTVKITAAAQLGSKYTVSVTFKVAELVQSIKPAAANVTELIGGKSATYKVVDAEGKELKAADVTWFLCDENGSAIDSHPYASVNAKGSLTTKVVADSIKVYLMAKVVGDDQSAQLAEPIEVTLYPAITNVDIIGEDGLTVMDDGKWLQELSVGTTYQTGIKVYPEAGAVKSIEWKSSKTAVATVDGTGLITPLASGTTKITVTVTALDGKKTSASFEFTFGRFVQEVALTVPEVITGGEKVTLGAEVLNEADNKTITWSLPYAGDKSYATLTTAGVLTAKAVTNPVTIIVRAASKDGWYIEDRLITIYPKPVSDTQEALLIWNDDTGEYLTKTTQTICPDDVMDLAANADVTWTSSKPGVAEVDPDTGLVTAIQNGSTTITAAAADGRKATFTLKVSKVSVGVEIFAKNDVDLIVASGKALDLTATVTFSDGTSDNKVTWYVSDDSLAKISSGGKLTAAKNLTEPTAVDVIAVAKDGKFGTAVTVEIVPLATGVEIYGAFNSYDVDVSNTTQKWDMTTDGSILYLYAGVFPYDAIQDVTWKSSNDKVASIDDNGKVTCLKSGTVTITATAKDGSGKKASFKLTVYKTMAYLTLPETAIIAGGKSLTMTKLDGYAIDELATNKTLVWSITGGEGAAYATLSNKGVLKTKAVTKPMDVYIRAEAADGSGVVAESTVTIYPATTKVLILDEDDKNVTGQTLPLKVGQTLDLGAKSEPGDAAQEWTWSSSDKKAEYVTVDPETGCVEVIKAGKTVTITATANDGSGKKATVKIKAE